MVMLRGEKISYASFHATEIMISNMEGALLDIMNAELNGKSGSFTNKSAEICNFGFVTMKI